MAPRLAEPGVDTDPRSTPHYARTGESAALADLDERAQTEETRHNTGSVRTVSTATPTWRRAYSRLLTVTDALVIAASIFLTQALWLSMTGGTANAEFWGTSALITGMWVLALSLNDTRSYRVVGSGSAEFKRVWDASFALFGSIAIVSFLLRIDGAHGLLVLAFPVGTAALFAERILSREWLKTQRRRGRFAARVLLVGSGTSVNRILHEMLRSPDAGYHVVGVCIPTGEVGAVVEGTSIPIMGSVSVITRALEVTGADTVVVTSTDDLPPDKVKEISWALEAGRQHLLLAPSIVDIAGPRIHTRQALGLPLIHVETPRFTRAQRLIKRSFDVVASSLLILLLSPVLIALAITVRLTSTGPVFYRQERVGYRGTSFNMLKFRSMRQGAAGELAALLAEQGTSEQPLFKIKNDPRITPIGRILRKYSLDELPQLFNTLGGSMSLVGPRPQIAAEVALYSDAARRRLLARPGITGLWQVSGRSTLDWNQTVRLDLYYVENWSLLGDISILVRTVKAVVAPGDTAH